ncbi:uncharacterized protein PAC_11712 [Phialocephala subalpina]|uniref:Heterokaryon incompatibility domain-containing protein n=1 Tax=Phialocephala subalpina TaxID=576137 RepID=A0A1L7X9W0_9HELO|nr:uncharacterized protein PAC_11712 [Phialocephala subalpina]
MDVARNMFKKGAANNPLYQPLDTSRSEIRLLEISPSLVRSSTIRCRLKSVSLTDAQEFIALSYVWGDASQTKNISVNGIPFAATENLVAALTHIRSAALPGRKLKGLGRLPCFFWIDAICIDQGNIAERNSQVKMMDSIYQGAYIVLSWLGPTTKVLHLAIKVISQISGEFTSRGEHHEDIEWLQKYPHLLNTDSTEGLGNSAWNAVLEFCEIEYWRRVWVIQEIVLAKRLWMMVGGDLVDFRLLDSFLAFFTRLQFGGYSKPHFLDVSLWNTFSMPANICNAGVTTHNFFRRNPESSQRNDCLFEALDWTSDHRATDPRDKLFSLISISNSPLVPDYASPVEAVYTNFGIEYIKSRGNLNILGRGGLGNGITRRYDRPSWVHDWEGMSTYGKNRLFPLGPFNADLAMESFTRDQPVVGPANDLHAYGIACDSISEVEPRMTSFGDIFRFCCNYAPPGAKGLYRTSIPRLKAIFETILMELNPREAVGSKCDSNWRESRSREAHAQTMTMLRLLLAGDDMNDAAVKLLGLPLDEFLSSYAKIFQRELPQQWTTFDDTYQVPFHSGAMVKIGTATFDYRFFHTAGGYLGLGPVEPVPGDLLCVLNKCPFPVILRKVNSHYVLVGPCFVLGLMDGEAVGLIKNGEAQIQEFEIH